MGRASIFALASVRETFGVVLAEAMAAGLPIVATDAGGPGDIVTPMTGLLVPPMNVNAFALALRQVRLEIDRYDRKAISAHASSQYGRGALVDRLVAMYSR
jgi:glycosyltransferase involved in cell wall biosynthesis